jgi:hypothetical protein
LYAEEEEEEEEQGGKAQQKGKKPKKQQGKAQKQQEDQPALVGSGAGSGRQNRGIDGLNGGSFMGVRAVAPAGVRPVIVWFRSDLRLTDNPALAAASTTGRPVIPLYIHAPDDEEGGWPLGGCAKVHNRSIIVNYHDHTPRHHDSATTLLALSPFVSLYPLLTLTRAPRPSPRYGCTTPYSPLTAPSLTATGRGSSCGAASVVITAAAKSTHRLVVVKLAVKLAVKPVTAKRREVPPEQVPQATRSR